jgi:hypothetical protein
MRIFFCIYLVIVLVSGCTTQKSSSTKLKTGNVELIFTPYFSGEPITMDSIYSLPNGEKISFRTLRFFINDIALAHGSGKESTASIEENDRNLFLVDYTSSKLTLNEKLSYTLSFKVAAGDYSDIRYTIGVPREVNHGNPDTAPELLKKSLTSEMYWEWNSGYIFFLTEGKIHDGSNRLFHFAIGEDRRVMPLSFGNLFNIKPLIQIEEGKLTKIYFAIDMDKVFVNSVKSNYSLKDPEAAIVHGGYYADVLRNNIVNSFRFISSEIVK